MEAIWSELYDAAKRVQNERKLSDYMDAGGVAVAILSSSGKINTGVCIDTCSTLGICAERNAIFNMITNGESIIQKVIAIMLDAYQDIEIMLDYETGKVVTLGTLTPEWWIGK